ncbi:MAG: type I methionyl aminopeptidase [Anaerolineae bacterium]|nr:type I methionyl aminopeptidase [Ardenticatenia bacterium]MBK8539796.1 type I methionyl aminopeptidase [Ardenticatenia bacterium]HQZ70221.1 type I methionyl aminopeptidase [Anaerolineae bacterium]HRA19963.1 type I methionyl aminopeptidase [Anaerolineae bacterium]
MSRDRLRRGLALLERRRPPRVRAGQRLPGGILLKTPEEIAMLRESGRLVAQLFELLGQAVRPGAVLRDLDRMVEEEIRSRGALTLYKGYRGQPPTQPPFPGVICASVNEEICHGIPDGRRLEEGDIVGIDIGLRHQGWCGDACVTYAVGQVSAEAARLLQVAEECLWKGIAAARPGRSLRELGAAIQEHAETHGYSVVTAWGGHGLGRSLHEPPSVPHTGEDSNLGRIQLREGMVFTIEPMINAGSPDCEMLPDGWTVVTPDGRLSAQFEHTVAITADGAQVLSAL